jgi:hypothetical protein
MAFHLRTELLLTCNTSICTPTLVQFIQETFTASLRVSGHAVSRHHEGIVMPFPSLRPAGCKCFVRHSGVQSALSFSFINEVSPKFRRVDREISALYPYL